MKKIMTVLHPFVVTQTLTVYEDGNKIDVVETPMQDVEKTILNLVEKYDIKKIEFVSSRKFSEGIGNKIKENLITKYNKDTIEIKYL